MLNIASLNINGTLIMTNISNNKIKKTTIIHLQSGPVQIVLPNLAKFVMQDRNGVWYWSEKKAKIVFHDKTNIPWDWFSSKHPIQIKIDGFDRVLISAPPVDWTKTQSSVIPQREVEPKGVSLPKIQMNQLEVTFF